MKKSCLSLSSFVCFVAVLSPGIATRAANLTTMVQQGTGNKWSDAIWQPGGVVPVAGNTYECVAGGNPTRVRNPASGSGDAVIGVKTFPGDWLQMDAGSEIRSKGPGNTLDFPGKAGEAGLILNGGNLDTGDNAVFPLTGVILVQADSSFSAGDSGANNSRGWQVAAEIRGNAGLTLSKAFADGAPVVELTGVNNPFTGNWTVNGGIFKATGVGSLGSGSITINPGNAGATFEPMYDVISAGTLTLAPGNVVMNLHQDCSFTGVFINGVALPDGFHDWTELNADYPSYFPVGSGSITVQPPPPPPAPMNLTVVNGDGEVTLNWSVAPSASSYNVKRSDMPGPPYTVVGTPTGNSFVDMGLVNGSTYYYVVSAVNTGGEGPDSNEAIGRPNNAVTGLTAAGGTGQVALAWNVLPGASSYTVKRGTSSGGPYTDLATGVTMTSYVDNAVNSGNAYFYVVAGILGAAEGGISAEAVGTTAPGAPTNLRVSRFDVSVLRVGWVEADPVISQFRVEQSTDNINFVPLATVPGNQPSYTNASLAGATTYFYRVQAENAGGLSPYSEVASNTTPIPGSGILVNFALATAPVPPGYVPDGGDVYGDRGNGYSYGWNRDVTADSRYRMAANSPDVRYDTLVHLIKATPPAFWEIEVPNGYYLVHIVAGDPSNVDSVFQFDVEGVLTDTYIPSAPNYWGDFTINCSVSDGRLTVNSGPNSQTTANNNKIAFIDIYPDVPVPPVIGVQPQDQTVEEYRSVSLSVTISEGSPRLDYQWYLNDINNPVPDATNRTLTIDHVLASDAGQYFVVVTNYAGAATSEMASLTVMPDTTPPFIVSAGSLDGRSIGLCFNEELDTTQGALTEAGNYEINGDANNVLLVTVLPGARGVRLDLLNPISGPFTLHNAFLQDLAGNAGASDVAGVVLGYTAQDIGGPSFPGSNFTCDGDTIEIVGGGADIWGASDQGYLATKPISGDFDARVRVTGLRGANAITKAVLVARETTEADSRALHVSLNPTPPGRNLTEMGFRSDLGGATTAIGNSFVPAGVPNAWMRISRVGDLFTGYRSTNGMDWIQFGQTNVSFPAEMQVGIGVTAHDDTLLATGTFSGLIISVPTSQQPIVNLSYSEVGGFSGAIQTQVGVTYEVQFKDDLNAAMWNTLKMIIGDGTVQPFVDANPGVPARFYRVLKQ